jgi:formylmethanofuran dehydrogenase subunit E
VDSVVQIEVHAGLAISGVTITIKSTLGTGSGITDKQGKYAVTVLCTEQSRHTVTPAKAGYTFQPPSRPWDKYTGGPSFTGRKQSK